jgi:Uma2 family endonuclease
MAIEIDDPADEVQRRLFTVKEYHLMGEAGIFDPDEKLELIEGIILKKNRMTDTHAACSRLSNYLAHKLLGDSVLVGVRNPIEAGPLSEPEPDLALLRPRDDYYRTHRPGAEDILLLAELADTARLFDHEVKGLLYACIGISEYWFVNLIDEVIEINTEPTMRGYRRLTRYWRGDTVQSVNLPAFSFLVDDLLGPPTRTSIGRGSVKDYLGRWAGANAPAHFSLNPV